MKHTWLVIIHIGIVSLLSFISAGAQVNAGDADNNGVVDHHDVLYVGYAFGTAGPRRVESDTQADTISPVSLYWAQNFPTGQNYIFADADGNGLVDWPDFIEIYNHYGTLYHELRTTTYPEGDLETSPALDLQLADSTEIFSEGSMIEMPLFLGSFLHPINEFQGLAFSIQYDSTYIRELRLEIDSTSWLVAGEETFSFQNFPTGRESVLDIAFTRLGQRPVSGFGYIGTLSIIIEDDLVDFKPFEKDSIHTYIHLNGIELRDVEFNSIPVVSERIKLNIVHPKLLSGSDAVPKGRLLAYPNPVVDWLRLESTSPVHRLEVWDLQGRLVFEQEGIPQRFVHCFIPDLPLGVLLLKVFTEKDILVKKILHLQRPNH